MNEVEPWKVGDIVVYSPGGLYAKDCLKKVERVTPSGFAVVGGVTFNRRCKFKSYARCGDSYLRRPTIELATQDDIEEIGRLDLIEEIKALVDSIKGHLDKATSDKLESIKTNFTNVYQILKE